MKTTLGKIVALYPDGISLSAYQAVGRLIKRFGPIYKIELKEVTHEELDRLIKKLNSNGG